MSERWLARALARNADGVALHTVQGEQTWAELAARARSGCEQLRALGVQSGDRVGMLIGNTQGGIAAVHAAQAADAVLVPLHGRLDARDLAEQVRRAAIGVLVCTEPTLEPAGRVASRVAGLRVTDADRWPDSGTADPFRIERGPAEDRLILFTSGTTRRPKAVRLSGASLVAAARASASRLGHGPEDCWLMCMPPYHVGGLSIVIRCALYGMAIRLQERFEPEAVASALVQGAFTLGSLVPTMLARVLDVLAPHHAHPRVRAVLVGGGPVAPALLDRARATGVPVAPTYGLTEAGSQVTTLPPEAVREGERSAGPPLSGTEVRIVDGEIQVRGPTLMTGYLDDPDETARSLRSGWLHTGDAGRLDPLGHLEVLDRRSDLIVCGGENVSPREIEAVLETHPDVEEAAVVGAPDPEWGQRVAAHVVLRRPGAETLDGLRDWCRARLPGFKVPREFARAETLPRTPTGKLRRAALRAPAGSSAP